MATVTGSNLFVNVTDADGHQVGIEITRAEAESLYAALGSVLSKKDTLTCHPGSGWRGIVPPGWEQDEPRVGEHN